MNLRETINRLEALSHGGKNDNLPVVLPIGHDFALFPEITSAMIMPDPDYNFDEANCGPDEKITLDISCDEREVIGLNKIV